MSAARPADRSPTEILELAHTWLSEGRQVAIATVVETCGSSPRPAGSNLVIDADGNFVGSLSGGCIEDAVADTARSVIDSGKARLAEFTYTDDAAWDAGLPCGGNVKVFVESIE